MAEQKENAGGSKSSIDQIAKAGIYVKAERASDNYNEKTDKFGAGKGLERYYPDLDGNDTIGALRKAAKKQCWTDEEDYIFYKKDTKNVAKDSDLIKDVANFSESKDNNDDGSSQKITINAKKTYPNEEPGETADAANKLVEEVTKLDTKAYYAVGSIDGCQIVLENILKLLSNIFANVDKDPLLQTIVTMAKYDLKDDKDKVEKNQAALKKLLLELGAYKQSEIEKIQMALGITLSSLAAIEGIKWGTKKAYNRLTRNRAVYEGPQTKWQSRFSTAKKWGGKILKGGMKFIGVAAQIATIGLTIYGIVEQQEMQKKHWRQVCQQLIEQKQKRYDDYEDIYTRYNDLSDTMWMLRNQFVTNFNEQCSEELKTSFQDKPTVKSLIDNDKTLKSLISEVMGSLTNIQNYLNGLLGEYIRCDTAMSIFQDLIDVKSVEGYNKFIAFVEKKDKITLNDKQKARYIDCYVLWLLDTYYQVKDDSKFDQILPYDKELENIIKDFPSFDDANGVSLFGQKDAPLHDYIQQMRITYLYFDGTKSQASSTGSDDAKGPTVTFSFVQKVQELYDSQKK